MRRILFACSVILYSTLIDMCTTSCTSCGRYGLCLKEQTVDGNSTASSRSCETCACSLGVSGTCCERNPTPCNPNPCSTNETCVVVSALYFECQCISGVMGLNCDEEYYNCTEMITRTVEQITTTTANDYEDEYSNTTTEVQSTISTSSWLCQDCLDLRCLNNGTCAYNSTGDAVCICSAGFEGEICEIQQGCANNPCQNGGFCSNVNETDYECECLSLFNGTNCEELSPCNARPCNNGTCVDLTDGEFVCDCTPGYDGEFCTNIINMCDPNPCEYNGTCTSFINDYECDCPANSGGKNCSDITNMCESETYTTVCNANDTNATCEFVYLEFTCFCSEKWAGEYCNITRRVYDVLPYFPNATVETIQFLETIATSANQIQAATAYIVATMEEDLTDVSWDIDDLFVWAAFEQREINYTNEFVPSGDSTNGRCYTFNSPDSQTIFNIRTSGSQNGLSMLVNIQQSEYIDWIDLATLNIYVHPFNQPVFAESLSYDVMPGAVSGLRVAMNTYTSLGGHYSKCAETSRDVTAYYYKGNYTSDACLWSCYQTRVLIQCGCMDPRYAIRRRAKPCGLDEANCVFNVIIDYGDPNTWGDYCTCPNECEDVQYDVLWDTSTFTANPIECGLLTGTAKENCLSSFDDQAIIFVYFPDPTQTVYEETAKWNINSILSYFGGIVGVVMGFSFISILEGLFLFYRCLLVLCTNEKSTLEEVDIESVSSSDDDQDRAKELKDQQNDSMTGTADKNK
ncbi:EGF-like domain protein [Aphelenchoides besseyi]|nr:EGF-like domain protein [Aphelenchoides besseyi]